MTDTAKPKPHDGGTRQYAAPSTRLPTEGLTRLGVLHHTTLPYSPYQNAKQEAFWGPVEGRLVAMLEHVPDLTIGTTPLARLLEGPARRPAPTMPTISKKTTNPQPVPSLCRAKWASRRSRPPLEARSLS
jgi:transposase InsO family protein